jgi:hypothetical protein
MNEEQEGNISMSKIKTLRELVKIQGYNGNWNYDPYMHGLYNGLEFALSIMEKREPYFRDAPEQWLADIPMENVIASEASI